MPCKQARNFALIGAPILAKIVICGRTSPYIARSINGFIDIKKEMGSVLIVVRLGKRSGLTLTGNINVFLKTLLSCVLSVMYILILPIVGVL